MEDRNTPAGDRSQEKRPGDAEAEIEVEASCTPRDRTTCEGTRVDVRGGMTNPNT